MKINILYKFKSGAWGGGNQFLKALRSYFIEKNFYTCDPLRADVLLFNSHHCFRDLIIYKLIFRNKIFLHRIDGPVSGLRGVGALKIDKNIYKINKFVADGTIFQSCWSREENLKKGYERNDFETIILNASDPSVFNDKADETRNGKIRILSCSWSDNARKGFEMYKYLDEELDFTKYEMTFIGNSPIKFKNVKVIGPMDSKELAKNMAKNDIYVTASQNDPCSNSVIEAISCGLPVVALNSGGHPEVIRNGGELFTDKSDIIEKIEKVAFDYKKYKNSLPKLSLDIAGSYYIDFAQKIYKKRLSGRYNPKKLGLMKAANLLFLKKRDEY